MLFLLWFNNPAKKRTAWLEPRRGVGRVTNEQESAVEQQPVLHLYRQPEASEGRGTGMALGMAWGAPYALQGWEQHFTLPCRWGKQPCPWARSERGIFEAGQLRSAGLHLKHSGLVAVRHWGCSWGHDVQEGLWHSHGSFCRGQMRTDRVAWNLQQKATQQINYLGCKFWVAPVFLCSLCSWFRWWLKELFKAGM